MLPTRGPFIRRYLAAVSRLCQLPRMRSPANVSSGRLGSAYPDAWGSADATNPGPCGGTSNGDTTDTTDALARRVRRVRNVIPQPRRTPAP